MNQGHAAHYPVVSDRVARTKGFYSQAVCAEPFLYVSGRLPLDIDGAMALGGIAEQTLQTLDNVKAILEVQGPGLSSLEQCTIFISELESWPEVNRVHEALLKNVPVCTRENNRSG